MALCTIITILLTLQNSEQKNGINKTFFVFHLILMKHGEVVVTHVYYSFTKLDQNRMKNKKVLGKLNTAFLHVLLYLIIFKRVALASRLLYSSFASTYFPLQLTWKI